MIQLDTETASNQNIYAGAVTALTHTLPASPTEHLVAANIQVSALAASVSRALTIRLLADAQEVFKSDVLFTSGSATADKVRWLAVPPLPLRGGQVITITVQSDNAGDTAVTLTAYLPSHDLDYILAFRAAESSPTADSPIERLKALDDGTAVVGAKLADVAHGGAAATITLATPVEANAVEISGDGPAADALETVLDGTGGAVLMAAQLKLSCDKAYEGALDCRNINTTGYGQCNYGDDVGQYNVSPTGNGQDNDGAFAGQFNWGGIAGQYNTGPEAQKNEGTGDTPKALTLIGAADLLDDILADTAALDTRLPAVPASQGDVTGAHAATDGLITALGSPEQTGAAAAAVVAAHATTDGKVDAAKASADAAKASADQAARPSDVTTAHGTTDGKVDAAKASADAAKASADAAARPSDVTTAHATTDGKVDAIAEQTDVKTSTRSNHSASDVWVVGTRTLTSFGTLVVDVAAAVWNRLTSALTVAGSVGKYLVEYLAAIKAKTDILTLGAVEIRGAVAVDGTVAAVRGDDYLAAMGTAVRAEIPNYAGPSIAGATKVEFSIGPRPDGRPSLFTTEEATAKMNGTTLVLEADLPGDESAAIEPGRYLADWQITLAGTGEGEEAEPGPRRTPWAGLFVLQADVTE